VGAIFEFPNPRLSTAVGFNA